jgi:hypothetical protein
MNQDNTDVQYTSQPGGYLSWGSYRFEIARDGSCGEVVPIRDANNVPWGYHMNVVKLLEVSPGKDCVMLKNIHPLANGDVSVDISIIHPYLDKRYTAFDVMGIIIFPASYTLPDNEIRAKLGMDPWTLSETRVSNSKYGDAELINADGLTDAWNTQAYNQYVHFTGGWCRVGLKPGDKSLPIFNYYQGKFATGDNLSTINGFKRYYSNEDRHMFEVGKTVTRTFIIRPPATGPILASYSIYAHWWPATTVPVNDPAKDFPPEANSALPYEFYITQDSPLDPNVFKDPNMTLEKYRTLVDEKFHWHIKTWDPDTSKWQASMCDIYEFAGNGGFHGPHPCGAPDDYYVQGAYFAYYVKIPDGLPGTYPLLCFLTVREPAIPSYLTAATAVFVLQVQIADYDGSY